MDWSHLMPGLRLEMIPVLTNGEPAAMSMPPVSQLLQAVTDPGRMLVAVPIRLARHVSWPIGSRIKVSFSESDKGIWQFDARILAVCDVDGICGYMLSAETGLRRLQRRAHFRVKCAVDVTLTLRSPDQTVHAVTCDISGGGVCILLDHMLLAGSSVRIKIALGNGRIFQANSRVVRTQSVQIGHFNRYKVSLQYVDIPHEEQDSLIRCLMSWQKRQKAVGS